MIGTLAAAVVWTALALVLRHELREQRRSDGTGWKAPGS